MWENNQNSCYIIAEAGVNHNGDIELAKQLIDAAVQAGVDAIKFQTFNAEKVISKQAPKAEYQKKTTNSNESQLDMLKKLELDEDSHFILIEHCQSRNIEFLSTPFDLDSIDLLAYKLDLPCLKIPSGEITNGPYLLQVAKTGKPVILSTGMSTLAEVETALGVLAFGYLDNIDAPTLEKFNAAYWSVEGRKRLEERVILLHCTTEYPTPFNEVNLRAMETMRTAFGLPVGLSDHTQGIAVPIAAVTLGAAVIEKHFTVDRNLPGPDHNASLEPNELKAMVKAVRQVETALGNKQKSPTFSEMKNRAIARKSIVAAKPICAGEIFTALNLSIKRPGNGLSPMNYWNLIGEKSKKNYEVDEVI